MNYSDLVKVDLFVRQRVPVLLSRSSSNQRCPYSAGMVCCDNCFLCVTDKLSLMVHDSAHDIKPRFPLCLDNSLPPAIDGNVM